MASQIGETMAKLGIILALVAFLGGNAIQLEEGTIKFEDSIPTQLRRTAAHLSQLLRLRQQMEMLYSPLAHAGREVHDLGDGRGMEGIRAQEQERRRTKAYALLKLDQELVHFEKASDHDSELGEAWYPPSTDAEIKASTAKEVDDAALERLLNVEANEDTTRSVSRIVEFLANARADHELLSRAELDRIRQFYIDQTAGTLARYGFEKSPYGHQIDDAHAGDEVAARHHMDNQDQLMHTESDAAGPTKQNVNGLLRNLKETAFLSQFLDRLTGASHRVEDIEAKSAPVADSELTQLTNVQTDEENITNGIEHLLRAIKSGSDLSDHTHDNSATSSESLEDRTKAESARLTKLENDLAQLPTESTESKAAPKTALPSQVTPEVIRVPLVKLQKKLDHSISAQLDRALGRFKTMGANGDTVDPALRAKIEGYMSSISANMLHQCGSYQLWNQPQAITEETEAAAADSKDTLSRSVPGLHLSSSELVSRFLESKNLGVGSTAVPTSVQHLMTQGLQVPGVGRLVVNLNKP
jgi:hypothetical protein